MAYSWRLIKEGSESVGMETTEWDEVYMVKGFTQGTNPAFNDLLADRPDLAPNQPHPSLSLARVESFDPERLEDTEAWKVTVKYKIELRGEGDEEQSELDISPLLRPAKIVTDSELIEVPAFTWVDDGDGPVKDGTALGAPFAAGDAIVNTALSLMSDVTKSIPIINVNFSKNLPVYPTWMLNYIDAVNSDSVYILGLVVDPHYLKCGRVSISERQTEVINGVAISYYTVSFTLQYHPYTWETKILNRGLMQWNDTLQVAVPCVDSNKEDVTEPVFLDINGTQINPDGTTKVTQADIITLEGWLHRKLPFNGVLPLS